MKLSEDLKRWRVDRPDEWTMDRFIEKSTALEDSLGRIYTYSINCVNDKEFHSIVYEEAVKHI